MSNYSNNMRNELESEIRSYDDYMMEKYAGELDGLNDDGTESQYWNFDCHRYVAEHDAYVSIIHDAMACIDNSKPAGKPEPCPF